MFTLKLQCLPRLVLIAQLDKYNNESARSLSELSKLMKLSDRVGFTDEERKALNIRNEKNEESGMLEIKWNRTLDGVEGGEIVDFDRDIELSDEQKELLYTVYKELDEKKTFTNAQLKPSLEIAEKIGYEIK
jgi:hypothetical protein